MEEEKTTIQISKRLREAIEKNGIKGERYEDILWRLIEKETSNAI